MKLDELKRSGTRRPVYAGPVADVEGNKHYELAIAGTKSLIKKVFSEVDFEIEIAPRATAEEFDERSKRFLKRHIPAGKIVAPPIEAITALIGRAPPPVGSAAKDTVVVYLRPTEGEGTFWAMWLPFLTIPPGLSLSFVLPRVWTTWSVVMPRTGNPDLFLSLNSPFAPPVMTAVSPIPVTEGVSFTGPPVPWAQFYPWHRILAAAPAAYTVTDFGLGGHSLPWF